MSLYLNVYVCVQQTPLSDPEVKQKCQILFRQWAVTYSSTPGMERIVALQKQLPKRKKAMTQQQSKVLRETEPSPNDDPFSNAEDEDDNRTQNKGSPTRNTFASSSSVNPSSSFFPTSTSAKKSKSDKYLKKTKRKGFDLEKEKPQILQAIASSSIASTNLMNALKLIDREHKRVSEDKEAVAKFEVCKQLRRQILRYIQHIESDQWLGSLINANDALIEALMAFEILDKSVENDSDSEGVEWSGGEESAPPKSTETEQRNIDRDFAGLILDNKAGKAPIGKVQSSKGSREEQADSESDGLAEDDDDPFADNKGYA
ncbi:uncharacterized protein KY384_002591 [Bacidia gigantensis]|uniref:uncharacterized protein n=1 Tax=Bacidia gigantensis TaxID=2732470 RepID=UPI001D0558B7|nr:uncharacterized protein KY384_002591 [Bacidia gigantensis]KAG8532714.1 hypothetical protein KY384_002591 [Bacidia gigantensis]